MKELFLAYREPKEKKWYVIGKLWENNERYYFCYTQGVKNLKEFNLFEGMKNLNKLYESDELFPFFKNRLLNKRRPEYGTYLGWLGVEGEISPIDELALTNGIRITDNFQVFKKPVNKNGIFEIDFFVHGISHLPKCYQERIKHLKESEKLFIMKDIQNIYDKNALVLRTNDPIENIGYIPRYYNKEVNKLLELNNGEVDVTIKKINIEAPTQFQVLCNLKSEWPENFEVFTDDEFKILCKG
ncbi:HIRAN domain-containing protein [Caminibacter pacificus]